MKDYSTLNNVTSLNIDMAGIMKNYDLSIQLHDMIEYKQCMSLIIWLEYRGNVWPISIPHKETLTPQTDEQTVI